MEEMTKKRENNIFMEENGWNELDDSNNLFSTGNIIQLMNDGQITDKHQFVA
jgi:hypothetical protein